VFSIVFFSCEINTRSHAAVPDHAPKFGKIELKYEDTSSPEFKQIIYRLDTFYMRQVNAGFNGSVLVGYKGKILYERYFGLSNLEERIAWTSKTQSQLASTSKTLTSGAVLILHDKGLIDFDDNVRKYIPDFPYENITIRTLLNHRSGLADYTHVMSKPKDIDFIFNKDIVDYYIQKKPPLNFASNTRFMYSNTNFCMLAYIIEIVSGMKYKYFMDNKEDIFKRSSDKWWDTGLRTCFPCQMTRSHLISILDTILSQIN
jgi:CubicO group peptidase (beta-lactamase class C family)